LTASAENVIGIYSSCHSSNVSRELARMVAKKFNFKLVEIKLDDTFDQYVAQVKKEFKRLDIAFPDANEKQNNVIFGSLRSTLRAPLGRFVNRAFMGGLRVGTGNRDEDELVRFYQKGGDGEVDLNPIAALYKSEVWALAEHLGVPQQVINATPTPDLWGIGLQHTDESELEELTGTALTYTRPNGPLGTIEWVSRENEKNGCISGKNQNLTGKQLSETFSYSAEQIKVIETVRKMEKMTRHKSLPPPFPDRQALKKLQLLD
jgi:NAD+ synthetase